MLVFQSRLTALSVYRLPFDQTAVLAPLRAARLPPASDFLTNVSEFFKLFPGLLSRKTTASPPEGTSEKSGQATPPEKKSERGSKELDRQAGCTALV